MKGVVASAHPYIPNSSAQTRAEMLEMLGRRDASELYAAVPERLRIRQPLAFPDAIPSELELRRHVESLLARNEPCTEFLSFLGAGCWQHYVPAVCDEINQRAEFLTAYGGEPYSDRGKFQVFFECASLLAELVEMDAACVSTYDWGTAAATAIGMAIRSTGRSEVIIPRTVSPQRFATIANHVPRGTTLQVADYEPGTLLLDLDGLDQKLSAKTAAVYIENPTYLGFLEPRGNLISEKAHQHGALSIVGVDPISLGVVTPPGHYGADIVCGELQPLGMHMYFGGGLAGFVAFKDDPALIRVCPHLIVGISEAAQGEYGFSYSNWDDSSYVQRDAGGTFTGTATGLWAITAAVYLALLGPSGMEDLGRAIMQRAQYAARCLSDIEGVTAPALPSPFFKEFTVRFGDRGVGEVNRRLRAKGIFGGASLVSEFPELGELALICVTEIHTQTEIDRLATAVSEVL